MIMSKKLFALAGISVALFAQATPTDVFTKAPPEIDSALRKRVEQFLQAHVDGKWRTALMLTAEDSQDLFMGMEKYRYLNYKVDHIEWSENFTKAKVTSVVEVNWRPSVRMSEVNMKVPILSTWKIENGDWFWHTVPRNKWETPWGTMNLGKSAEEQKNVQSIVEQIRTMDPKAILRQVEISRRDINLQCCASSTDQVEIFNGTPGEISLVISKPTTKGLTITLAKDRLQSGEKTTLTFLHDPPMKREIAPEQGYVTVEPFGIALNYTITYALDPATQEAIKKQLGK